MAKKKKVARLSKEEAEKRTVKRAKLEGRLKKARVELKKLHARRMVADKLLQELIAEHNAKFETRQGRLERAEARVLEVQKRIDDVRLQIKYLDDPIGQLRLRFARHERRALELNAELKAAGEKL